MTMLQIYALISPVLGLAVVGALILLHNKQHARALGLIADTSRPGKDSSAMSRSSADHKLVSQEHSPAE
jgi:hypothetical protein